MFWNVNKVVEPYLIFFSYKLNLVFNATHNQIRKGGGGGEWFKFSKFTPNDYITFDCKIGDGGLYEKINYSTAASHFSFDCFVYFCSRV